MERWTRAILRLRWAVLAFWLAVLIAGGYASGRLSDLLSNTFTVPGTDSERARTILESRFNDRSDGSFTVVFEVTRSSDRALVARLQQQVGSRAEANALQVKVELQADCLSGVWVNREQKKRPNFLEAGDIDAALTTATAIGDDTLQRQATGRVVPDSFTHGSAAQRKQWFMTGYQQGTVQACNTFGAGS